MNTKKIKMNSFTIIGFLIAALFFTGCKKKNDAVTPELSASPSEINLLAEGGTADLTINGNAQWTISNAASWLQLSKTSGNSGSNSIQLTSTSNETGSTRSIFLSVNFSNGQARRVKVSQPPTIYPSYNTSPKEPDATGMGSTAVQLAAKMHLGINFGNTMESPKEAEWVNSKITESYVKFVKQIGFNTVRIPTGWVCTHLSDPAKAKIDPVWLIRVKEVVKYCVDNDMYVMLNAHGD